MKCLYWFASGVLDILWALQPKHINYTILLVLQAILKTLVCWRRGLILSRRHQRPYKIQRSCKERGPADARSPPFSTTFLFPFFFLQLIYTFLHSVCIICKWPPIKEFFKVTSMSKPILFHSSSNILIHNIMLSYNIMQGRAPNVTKRCHNSNRQIIITMRMAIMIRKLCGVS